MPAESAMGDEDFAALQQVWFRRLTTCGAVTAAGFTALLAGLWAWLHVPVLLIGAAILAPVLVLTLIALAIGRKGHLLVAAQIVASAGVAHAIVQSYLFPFAASTLAVSAILSVASVLPYVHGRPLRWLVVWSILSSLAIASLPRLSPFRDVVPPAAQQMIAMTALPAVTILTSLLLMQFSERVRYAREAESAAQRQTAETQRALEQTGQRLKIALAAAGVGIWVMDLDTGTVDFDDRCNAILGLARGTSLDYSTFLGLLHPDDRQDIDAAFRRAVRGEDSGKYDIGYRVAGTDTNTASGRWIRSTAQLFVDGSNGVRLIGTAQDVTAAKTNEVDLRAAKEQAESANRAKDEFLAMLGHELRNPLAPMLTALELLRVRMGEAGARERDVIHRQVRNLAQLVDDMLDVAQIRKGRMTIAKEALYARQVIAKALEFVTPMLEERRHRLQVDIEPPSLVIVGDERRLIQAVTNLLTNAVKYTEAGGFDPCRRQQRWRGGRDPRIRHRQGILRRVSPAGVRSLRTGRADTRSPRGWAWTGTAHRPIDRREARRQGSRGEHGHRQGQRVRHHLAGRRRRHAAARDPAPVRGRWVRVVQPEGAHHRRQQGCRRHVARAPQGLWVHLCVGARRPLGAGDGFELRSRRHPARPGPTRPRWLRGCATNSLPA